MSNEADARMSYRYMPIMGEFETSAELIVFKGRPIEAPKSAQPNQEAAAESPQPQVAESVGILISDHKMINGVLRATVKFSEITLFSVCEIIVNYDTRTKSHISAGLGGTGMMFSIRQWVPAGATQPVGAWNNLELAGVRSNLQCDVPYDLAVQTEGSIISLEVNGVQVLTTTLPFGSSQANPTGIFCVSKSDITVSNFTAKNEDPKAFIVMQFSSPYDEVYSHVIKDVCDGFSLEAVRADEIYGPGIIIKDVIDRISRSQVIIADISPTNPNVYFEVGYALALRKPIILLAQRREPNSPLPFDLSPFRVLFYDDSIGGKSRLEAGLHNHLKEILGGRD